LVVERLRSIVPHLLHPVQTVSRFAREIGFAAREEIRLVAHGDQHHGVDVARGLDELQEVARIEPSAARVDDGCLLERLQIAEQDVVLVVFRLQVRIRAFVFEMRRAARHDGRIHVRAITLGEIEEMRIRKRRSVELARRFDRERRRLAPIARGQRIFTVRLQRREIERVRVRVRRAPRRTRGADVADEDRNAGWIVHDAERAAHGRRRKQHRLFRLARQIADLIDADERSGGCE
jgi:hypothetical protein